MIVMMPVECVCEKCVNCPELEPTVSSYDITGIDNTRKSLNVNHIYCAKHRRCARLLDFLKKSMDENKKENEQDGEHEQ